MILVSPHIYIVCIVCSHSDHFSKLKSKNKYLKIGSYDLNLKCSPKAPMLKDWSPADGAIGRGWKL
jgi:hypothetical protein